VAAFAVAVGASLVGGALGGVMVGGKDLGPKVAGELGVLMGPVAGVFGVAAGVGLILLVG
jgi:hypothetical protein